MSRVSRQLAAVIAVGPVTIAGAHAADLDTTTATPPRYESYAGMDVYDWTSFYAGVHGGYVRSDFSHSDDDEHGFVGGMQLGTDYQMGMAVVGGEIEGTYFGGNDSSSVDQQWLVSAKSRLGVSMDRTLVYGTAGLSMARLEVDQSSSSPDGEWKAGYVVGGGVEHAFTDSLSLKAEYNYVGLMQNYTVGGNDDADLTNHILKAGLNYRF